jgi:hypothetical protein
MDFIERWFGVSPDSGSGAFEATLLIAILAVLAGALLVIKLRSARRRSV